MKKVMMVLIIIFAFNVSAITTNLEDSYKQKETAIVLIEGNIVKQIQNDQFRIEKGNSFIAVEYGLKNIDNKNYLWFVTPSAEGNYNLVIEDIQAIENGQSQVVDYRKNFSVGNESEDYYVKPGVLIASADFYATAVNSKNSDILISVDSPNAREITLRPGENRINFEIKKFEGTQTKSINIGKYALPSKIYGANVAMNSTNSTINQTGNENTSAVMNNTGISIAGNFSFEFGTSVIRTKVSNSSLGQRIRFEVKNTGEDELKNLQFNYNEEYFLIEPQEYIIPPRGSRDFELVVIKIPEGVSREAVAARLGSEQKYFLIVLEKTEEEKNISVEYVEEDESKSFFYCSELRGKTCGVEESCTGDEVDSLDAEGKCCLAECATDKSSGGFSWIGYLVAFVILIILALVFLKYRKASPNKESAVQSKFISAEKRIP